MNLADLALKLSDAGLDVSGWHALLAKSKATEQDRELAESDDGTLAAVGNLASLLAGIEMEAGGRAREAAEGASSGTPDGQGAKLADHVAQVNKEVEAITAGTEHKIRDLVHEIHEDIGHVLVTEDTKPRPGATMSRQKLLKGLAEIAQELCQPISVITCSLDLVVSQALGEVPEAQVELLELANESARRIQHVVGCLHELSGLPQDLKPNNDIRKALYEA